MQAFVRAFGVRRPREDLEAAAMLAVAIAALLTATLAIAGTRALCGTSHTVLLETLPELPPARAGTVGAVEQMFVSDRTGSRPARAPLRLSAGDAIELRGWAADPHGGGIAAAVFAVLDGGPAFRADYGIAPDAPNPPRRDGRVPFDVVVPAQGVARGFHELRVRVVARSLDGYAEAGPPLVFVLR